MLVTLAPEVITCDKCGTARQVPYTVESLKRDMSPNFALTEDEGCENCKLRAKRAD